MKFATTLFTCVVVTLLTITEDASAGNRSSGKSFGRSSGRSFSNRSRSFSSHQNRNTSMKKFSTRQKFHTPQTKKFTPKYNYQSQFKKMTPKNSNFKGFHKTTNHKFTKDIKFPSSQNNMKRPFVKRPITNQKQDFSKIGKVNTKHPFKPQHKPDLHHNKHIKHKNFFHGHHIGHHHGHNLWYRPWCHINVRPWCPPVCRPWYPVICEDPIIVPCQIISCRPVFINEIGEAVVAAPANEEKAQPERLALVAGQQVQLTAQGLGNEQGMVIIEINEMGLPAKIEKWEDTKLGFQTPQIGLGKATEAKMHIMNKKGQLLATLDVELLPEQTSKGNQVVAN